ncbi:MAG: PAS domain S-box protein [Bacteroidota bacterium]
MESKLRKEAESLLSSRFTSDELAEKSTEEIIHELKVHQIELELQNDELLQTQEKLLASQQKYFELFDMAPVAYLMVNSETRIEDANLTAAALFRTERSAIVNKRFDSFIHPDKQDAFYLFFKALLNTEKETALESCLSIEGKELWVKIGCNVTKNPQGQGEGLIRLTLIDITTEKLAQKELETVKERLELSLLAGNVAWWVWDYPSQTVFFDKKKAEMLGYADGRMTQNVYEITSMIHPDDYQNTMQHMRDHLEGKIPWYRLEYRLKTKQGSYKWFYDQGSVTQRSDDGTPLKICGVVIDITEKKNAELKHQESERRFRQFAALLPQMICELNARLDILYLNEYGKKLLKIADDAEKKNLLDLLDSENQQLIQRSIEKMIKTPKEAEKGIQVNATNTAKQELVLYLYFNLEIQNETISTIRAVGIDLTDRIMMENQLTTLNEELNAQKTQLEDFNRILEEKVTEEVEKNRMKDHLMSLQARQAAMGEMVGHIAHQWKQPLNTLNLIIMDMQDAFQYNELTQEYMNRSVDSAKNVIKHMTQTIDDFRNFFKPIKSTTSFDVKEQTQTALSFILATIEVAGITLRNELTPGIMVTGYPNEFSQVVINIVNNAREALIESQTREPFIEISSQITDHKVHLFFRNNGDTIPDNIMERIFEPYFTTKDHSKGTGIGLYLARTIIRQNMNGELKVKNTEEGVEFEIVLPLS